MDETVKVSASGLKPHQLDAIMLGSEQRIVQLKTDKSGRFDEPIMDSAIALLELLQAAIRANDAALMNSVVAVADGFCRVIKDDNDPLGQTAHWIVTLFHWNDQLLVGAVDADYVRLDVDRLETIITKAPSLWALLHQQHRRIQANEQWLNELRDTWAIPKGTTIHEFMKAMALERDALRADATLWRNGMKALDELRATVIPCGHTIGDLIGGHGAVTKCGACLASIREHRATLATRLKAAIRRQTVDVDDGNAPNGPVEQAIKDIELAVNPRAFYRNPDGARKQICSLMAALCKHMAADCKELREAADAYFGEDFTRPPPPTQP